MRFFKSYGKKLILKEMKKSFNFFIKEMNSNKKSNGYGLIRDKTLLSNDVASIASVGYGLAALVIGVQHSWIKYQDAYNFSNAILDTFINKANRLYCINNKNRFKTYNENSWGLTACLSPKGYCSFGAKPCDIDLDIDNDGTISPCGAIGSIVFTPKESIKAMEYYYNNFPKLWGKYGFKDEYNLENSKPWFAKEYIGIDKGICLIMMENYLNGTIWQYFMKNEYVKKGINILGFSNYNANLINT